jgi:hypothetical protein
MLSKTFRIVIVRRALARLAPPNNSMELSSGFAGALPDSAPLRPTAARRSLRLLRPWGVQLISRPLGSS